MNIALWILQVLLALHTVIGAVWKYSNSEQAVLTLRAIPHALWMALGVFEILCALCLVIPMINKSLGFLVPIAAIAIAGEMLLFCGVQVASGESNSGQLIYWLVVAAVCAFIAYGRLAISKI